MTAVVASPYSQGFAPATHGVGPDAPPVGDGNPRLTLDGLGQVALQDETSPSAARLRCHGPRNAAVARAHDPHVAPHLARDDRAIAVARRAVRTKAELVPLGHFIFPPIHQSRSPNRMSAACGS